MATFFLKAFDFTKKAEVLLPSNTKELSFKAVLIGDSEIKISETSGALNFNGARLTNIGAPTAASDVATKGYVDTNFVAASLVGVANGIATLDSEGKLTPAQIPAISITDTYVVDSQAAMLALNAQKGDVAIRTDISKTFILAGNNPSVLNNWAEILSPLSPVLSVNGKVGNVVLTTDDISEGTNNRYFTDARAQNAVVVQTITENDTTHAPSSAAVYTALNTLLSSSFLTETVTNKETSSVSAGTVLYYNSTNGGMKKASASSINTAKGYIAIAAETIAADGSGKAYVASGARIAGSGLTVGAPVFLSKTAGQITQDISSFSTGDVILQLGIAISQTQWILDIQQPIEIV